MNKLWLFLSTSISLLTTPTYADNTDLASYTIQKGDNLESIAIRYLGDRRGVDVLLANNQLKRSTLLQPGHKLMIPRDALVFRPMKAIVSETNCNIQSSRRGISTPIKLGSSIMEDTILTINKNCNASLMIEDGSKIRLLSSARVHIERLRLNNLENQPHVRIRVVGGKVEAKVNSRKDNQMNFHIVTPTAMAGVRGTIFRVGFDVEEYKSMFEVDQGIVTTSRASTNVSSNTHELLAQTGQVFDSTGTAGPTETLPLPPNKWVMDEDTKKIKMVPVTTASAYHFRSSVDLFFRNFEEKKQKMPLEIKKADLSRTAIFIESSSLTSSGLEGNSSISGICRSKFGCDIYINSSSLAIKSLVLQKINIDDTTTDILNKINFNQNTPFIIRGLKSGQYSWQAELQTTPELAIKVNGKFNIFVVN